VGNGAKSHRSASACERTKRGNGEAAGSSRASDGAARILGVAKQRHGSLDMQGVGRRSLGSDGGTASPRRAMHTQPQRSWATLRTDPAHRGVCPLSAFLLRHRRNPTEPFDPDPQTAGAAETEAASCHCRCEGRSPLLRVLCWKLPGPGGLPARWPAASPHSLRALAPSADTLTPAGIQSRIPKTRRALWPTGRDLDLPTPRVGIHQKATSRASTNQLISLAGIRFSLTER
jgi:hypothetical protein